MRRVPTPRVMWRSMRNMRSSCANDDAAAASPAPSNTPRIARPLAATPANDRQRATASTANAAPATPCTKYD